MKSSLTKLSVAPESTSAFMSAVVLLVLIETGTCIDRNRVVTITELNLWTALTQADGFRRSENPPFLQGLEEPILAHRRLRKLFLVAMYRLVVVMSSYERQRLLRRLRSCRRRLLLALDLGVGSNLIGCFVGNSTYVGDSCDLGVPFYDRCNTQLRVDPSVFLLLVSA